MPSKPVKKQPRPATARREKVWTQEDWEDLWKTIQAFKERVGKRANGSEVHQRECWECHNIATHTSSIAPGVCCVKCGSQDTRRIKGWDELFNAPAKKGEAS